MSNCIDQKFESIIHAYELGLLSGDELIKFEQHLMDCTSCYQEIESQLDSSRLLRHDPKLRPESSVKTSSSNTLKRFFFSMGLGEHLLVVARKEDGNRSNGQ